MNKLSTFFRARTTGARGRMGCTVLMQQTLTPRHMEVIIGTGRQRRWSAEMNARIAGESFEPGVGVSEVDRRDVAAEIGGTNPIRPRPRRSAKADYERAMALLKEPKPKGPRK
jgi:hypothetical protein